MGRLEEKYYSPIILVNLQYKIEKQVRFLQILHEGTQITLTSNLKSTHSHFGSLDKISFF